MIHMLRVARNRMLQTNRLTSAVRRCLPVRITTPLQSPAFERLRRESIELFFNALESSDSQDDDGDGDNPTKQINADGSTA